MWEKVKKSTVAFLLIVSCGSWAIESVGVPTVHADAANPVLKGGANRPDRGSSYWTTSNLREWLNSDASAGNVKYTQVKPDYASESGFLSGFSQAEKDGIAVTKHRVWISSYDAAASAGGSMGISSSGTIDDPRDDYALLNFSNAGLSGDHNNYYYKNDYDKVFLLNEWEVYLYEQKRGWSLTKTDTNGTVTEWWVNAPFFGLADREEIERIDSEGRANYHGNSTEQSGVAPTISLKPTVSVNGVLAKNMKIGSTITYGKYQGKSISWKVINKENGYPLLQSVHVLTNKQFDNKGDYSYQNSTAINFSSADIDMSFATYTDIKESGDTSFPYLDIVDDKPIFSRQNGAYAVNLKAIDSGSGIDHVELPDGSTTTSTSFTFKITENKTYLFKVIDKVGNYGYLLLPITNINPSLGVVAEPSTTDWTNQNVSVLVSANNEAGLTNWNGTSNTRDAYIYDFPNYTSYVGKQLRIKGTVSLKSASKSLDGVQVGLGVYFRRLVKQGHEYNLWNSWPSYNPINLSDLQTKGRQSFDFTVDVPDSYNTGIHTGKGPSFILHMNILSAEHSYVLDWQNVMAELVNTDDFAIKFITLPNGTIVNKSTYTDTLTKSGTYEYKVFDSRGQTTTKSVTVNIDKEAPSVALSPTTSNPTNAESLTLHASGADTGGSGVSQVQTPDGTWHNGSSADYTVQESSDYSFVVKDNAGNTTTKSVSVTFDHTNPELSISGNPTTDVHDAQTLKASATDASGVKRLKTPDGTWHDGSAVDYKVYDNGSYTFIAEDNAGNQKSQTVTVSKIGDLLYTTLPTDGNGSGGDDGSGDGNGNNASGETNLTGNYKELTFNPSTVHVEDNRKTAKGWSMVLVTSQLTGDKGTLQQGTLQMKAPSVTGSNNDPKSPLTDYQAIDTGTPITVLQATSGEGLGKYNFDAGSALRAIVPASAFKGTYQAQMTWQLVSAGE